MKILLTILLALMLTACGGGGGDTSASAPIDTKQPITPTGVTMNWNQVSWDNADWK